FLALGGECYQVPPNIRSHGPAGLGNSVYELTPIAAVVSLTHDPWIGFPTTSTKMTDSAARHETHCEALAGRAPAEVNLFIERKVDRIQKTNALEHAAFGRETCPLHPFDFDQRPGIFRAGELPQVSGHRSLGPAVEV